jgi:hypothetical protein
MLFRRRVITSAPERDVVVVKPRRPTGLYAALGVGTLFAIGLVTYLSWALPRQDRGDYETTAVIVDDREDGRAQRMSDPAPTPQNVIVNPPPVINTAPPIVNTQPPIVNTPPPVVVNPPRPVIVEGAGTSDDASVTNSRRRNRDTNGNSGTSNDTGTGTSDTGSGDAGDKGTSGDTGDVDGAVSGSR